MQSRAPATNRLLILPFVVGNTVSVVGNVLTLIALPWFVLETTGSAGKTGLTGMAFALPAFISGIVGGVVIDRIGGRRMSVIADIVSGAAVFAIPLLHETIGLAFWQLLVLVFVGAILDIPGLTARRTMLPGLGERAGLSSESMNSTLEMSNGAAALLGPIVAGVLIGSIGAENVLYIDAGTFAISAILIGIFTPDVKPVIEPEFGELDPEPTEDGPLRASWNAIRAGLVFIAHDRLLLALAGILLIANFFNGAVFRVVLPVLVYDRYGEAADLGVLQTAFGIGQLAGAGLFAMYGARFRDRRWGILFMAVVAVSAMRWALVPHLPMLVVAGVMGLTGLLAGPMNPMLMTVRFERIPPAMYGRVFASFTALALVADPLGMAGTGAFMQWIGVNETLLALAILFTALVVVIPLVPALREMNRDVEPTSQARRVDVDAVAGG